MAKASLGVSLRVILHCAFIAYHAGVLQVCDVLLAERGCKLSKATDHPRENDQCKS